MLRASGVELNGLFLNADAGFDAVALRAACEREQIEANVKTNPRSKKAESTDYEYFDEELYKRRLVIEQSNAWLDSFKTLLVRFETLPVRRCGQKLGVFSSASLCRAVSTKNRQNPESLNSFTVKFIPADYLFEHVPELGISAFEMVIAVTDNRGADRIPADNSIYATVAAIFKHFVK